MSECDKAFSLSVERTANHCPIGEDVGKANMESNKIPVYSCEGACIRGDIARKAANLVAKQGEYRRGCHGELFTVPASAIARWTRTAGQVVLIDGCFLRCHGRILEDLLGSEKIIQFDALSHYKKYNDIFNMDDVPEEERNEVARDVADWVLRQLEQPGENCGASTEAEGLDGCCSAEAVEQTKGSRSSNEDTSPGSCCESANSEEQENCC